MTAGFQYGQYSRTMVGILKKGWTGYESMYAQLRRIRWQDSACRSMSPVVEQKLSAISYQTVRSDVEEMRLSTSRCMQPSPFHHRSETFRFANRNLPLNQIARSLNEIHCVLINVRPGLGDNELCLPLALCHTTLRKRLARRLKLGITPTPYGSPASQDLTLLQLDASLGPHFDLARMDMMINSAMATSYNVTGMLER